MNKLSFPTNSVIAGTAPEFFGRICDPETGRSLMAGVCYKIILNVVIETEFEHGVVPVPYYVDVEVPLGCLEATVSVEGYELNFRHRCEVYDENGTPHSAFVNLGVRHRVEYAFYWRDAKGREKLPIKIVKIVNVI